MADTLVISDGHTVMVEHAMLADSASRLRQAESELIACLRTLASIDRRVGMADLRSLDAPISAAVAERAMDDAERSLRLARDRVTALIASLGVASQAYRHAESGAEAFARQLSSLIAFGIGRALPLMLPFAAPVMAGAVGVGLAVALSPRREEVALALSEWMLRNSAVVSDPVFVSTLRIVMSAIDDIGLGAIGAQPGLAALLGEEGLGIVGLATAARVVFGIANGAGALQESRVSVNRVGAERTTEPPRGWQDRAARIPDGEVPIRIDRYPMASGPDRFEVYVAGTQDFSPVSGSDPFDLTSNVAGVAGLDSGAERAVRQAMRQAGIGPENPVVLSGHSQGGLVVASIAASGEYEVAGLFTLGAPVAGIDVPDGVPWIAVEHDDDMVAALGGNWRSDDAIVVHRRVYDAEPDVEPFAPAHRRDNYVDTAALIDGSTDRRLVKVTARLALSPETTGSKSFYDATRS
ncbi:hypothetical protein BH09ACT3_BH09ACT3_11590 [soil metagenome]